MRNLKRVLALALALVMVIGMMVMGTSAASYTDAESITADYIEAVDVMSGVGMFEGEDDGSFLPQEVLTRKQAAALLARLQLGKATADKLIATTQIFSDVAATAWYAPYVEYCYQAGLIDGLGNGTFNPDGELTGIAFAKLILVAMGYDADAQGYVGKDWAANIAIDALKNGLTVKGVVLADKVTREVAAQMLFQALEQDTVAYNTYFDKDTNAPILGGYHADGNTFMGKYFPSLRKVAGTIDDTTATFGTTTLTYTTKKEITNWWGVVTGTEDVDVSVVLSNTDADWTNVGYAAYAWYLAGKTSNTALYLGITGKDLAVSNDGTSLADLTTKSVYNPYYVASLSKTAEYVLNGEFVDAAEITNVTGTEITLIDNNKDGVADVVSAVQYTAAKVDALKKLSVTGTIYDYYYTYTNLANGAKGTIPADMLANVDALGVRSTITFVQVEDIDTAADLKLYDEELYYTDLVYVTATTKAVEKFSAITWLTVGGAKVVAYTLADVASVPAGVIYTKAANYSDLNRLNLTEDLTVVYDHNGYILSAELYADPDAYVLVLDNEDSHGIKNIAETEVAYIDGTVTEIEVACKGDIEDGQLAEGLVVEVDGEEVQLDGAIYTYKTNKAGYVELTDIDNEYAKNVTYVDNSIYFDDVLVTDKTTFIDLRDVLKGKASVGTVYEGYLDLPGITKAEIFYTFAKDDSMDLCFIVDGTNTANLKDSFVVFNTKITVETAVKAGKGLVYTYTLNAGVISGNELVPAYELTAKQAAAIATYGVGSYTFGVDGELAKYVSFDADKVTWTPESSGTVVYKNIDITDAYSMHFLDISLGKYHNWTQVVEDGEYYAIVDTLKKIAYIVGDATIDEATYPILATGTAFTGYDNQKYVVAAGYVTDVQDADKVPTEEERYDEKIKFVKEFAAEALKGTNLEVLNNAVMMIDGLLLDEMSVEEYLAFQELKQEVLEKIAEVNANKALSDAKADVQEAGDAYIDGTGWTDGRVAAAEAKLAELVEAATAENAAATIASFDANATYTNPLWAAALAQVNAANTAVGQLKDYDPADYSQANAAKLPDKDAAEAAIKACATAAEMADIVTDFNTKGDAVLTYVKEQAAAKLTTAAGKVVNIEAVTLDAATIKTAIDTAIADNTVTVEVTDVVAYADSATCTVTLSTANAENVVLKNVSVALDV